MFPDRLYYELITMVDFKNTLNEEMRNLKVGKQKKVELDQEVLAGPKILR